MAHKSIKILMIEDNPGDARLIREMLAEAKGTSFELEWTQTLTAGLQTLASGGIDLVLLDLSLPDSFGFETFETVRSEARRVPVIILSGLSDEIVANEMSKRGAPYYISKVGLDSDYLVDSILFVIDHQQQLTEETKQSGQELQD